MRYIPGGVAPPPYPRKAKAIVNCRAPVVCLVTVPVSCLNTAAVPGEETPAGHPRIPPPRARSLVLGHRLCLVLGRSNRAGGGNPPWIPPPSSTPPGAGSQIYLLILKNSKRPQTEGTWQLNRARRVAPEDLLVLTLTQSHMPPAIHFCLRCLALLVRVAHQPKTWYG